MTIARQCRQEQEANKGHVPPPACQAPAPSKAPGAASKGDISSKSRAQIAELQLRNNNLILVHCKPQFPHL